MRHHALGWADLHRLVDRAARSPLREPLLAAGVAVLAVAVLAVLFLLLERSEPWTR